MSTPQPTPSSQPGPLAAFAKRSTGWSIALSILLILVGFLAIIHPGISGIGMTIFLGWLMIISGFFHLIFGWRVHTAGRVIWEILVGLLYIFAGFFLIWHPARGLVTLTLILAFYLLFEGIFQIILAFQLRPHPGWGWMIFNGLVTLLLCFMIWRSWPASSVWAIGTLVGISMLFNGFSRFGLAMAARKALA
jgi:uncharacterized membrane protein HdeD (DUF308 family)